MNPHALTWAMSTMPVAASIAICTLIGTLVTKDRRDFSMPIQSKVLLAFMLWICITLPFSFDIEGSIDMWKRVEKIDFMVLVTLVLLHSKQHLITFIWVVVGSVGYFGIKGGLFTLITGGAHRVWGPSNTFIEGNNELALALILIIPLFRFLQLQLTTKLGKHAISGAMVLCAAAALGSHSRGALVAIVAMAASLWWYGGKKIGLLIAMTILGSAMIAFMPTEWISRMDTIGEYQDDASAMGRINAWWMAWNLALDRFFGGGFNIYNFVIFSIYAPIPEDVHAAHSIYFQVLGEHGFIGLFLFLLLWWLVWREAGKLRKEGTLQPETLWLSHLGAMCQVSLIGYAVGGAFLSLAYFDLPYNILIMVVVARRWLNRKAWRDESNQLQPAQA